MQTWEKLNCTSLNSSGQEKNSAWLVEIITVQGIQGMTWALMHCEEGQEEEGIGGGN